MNHKQWVDLIHDAAKSARWDRVYSPHHALNQSFARILDDSGLEDFHDQALRLISECSEYERIHVGDLSKFEATVTDMLRQGLGLASRNTRIKALYIEYFYDGGDCCNADLFPCHEYTREDDFWAAEFQPANVISGPSVFSYLCYDPEGTFNHALDCIARYYVDAKLLGAVIRAWKGVGAPRIPLGFSEHDGRIVHIGEA